MLSAHDRVVVSRDPALTGLSLLLDDEALLEWLKRNPPEADGWADLPEEVTCRYLRYKPGVRLVGAFELRTASGYTLQFKAWAVAEGGRDKLEKAIRELPPAFAPARRWCRTLRVMVQFHPDDRDLPYLARIADPGAREALLGRRLPELAGQFQGPLRILSYKPERRFVAALSRQGEPAAVVRGYTADRFSRSLRGARAFRTTPEGFRIPRLLGESRGAAILIQEWLQGTPQGVDCWGLRTPAEAAVLADRIGRALHGLHSQGARNLRRPECSGLSGAVAGVESVRPGDTAALPEGGPLAPPHCLPGWRSRRRPWSTPLTTGNFSPRADPGSGDRIGPVDFDRRAGGTPTRTWPPSLAHLEAGARGGSGPGRRCVPLRRGGCWRRTGRTGGTCGHPERFPVAVRPPR